MQLIYNFGKTKGAQWLPIDNNGMF